MMDRFKSNKHHNAYTKLMERIFSDSTGEEMNKFLALGILDETTIYKSVKLYEHGLVQKLRTNFYWASGVTGVVGKMSAFSYLMINDCTGRANDNLAPIAIQKLTILMKHKDFEKNMIELRGDRASVHLPIALSVHFYSLGFPQYALHNFHDCVSQILRDPHHFDEFFEKQTREIKYRVMDVIFKKYIRLIDYLKTPGQESLIFTKFVANFKACELKLGSQWSVFTPFVPKMRKYMLEQRIHNWIDEYCDEFKDITPRSLGSYEHLFISCDAIVMEDDDSLYHHAIRSGDLNLINKTIEYFPKWINKVNRNHVLPLQIPIAKNDNKLTLFLQEQGFASKRSNVESLPNDVLTHIMSFVVNISNPNLLHLLQLKMVSIQFYEAVQSDAYWMVRFFYKYHKMTLTRENWKVMSYYKTVLQKLADNTSGNAPEIIEKLLPADWHSMTLTDLKKVMKEVEVKIEVNSSYLLDSKMKEGTHIVKQYHSSRLDGYQDKEEIKVEKLADLLKAIKNATVRKYIIQSFSMTEEDRIENVTKKDSIFHRDSPDYPIRVWEKLKPKGSHYLIISRDLIVFLNCEAQMLLK
jgi:hypothetical protein